jgi:hypothetical protein
MRRFELPTPTQVKVVKYQTRGEHHGDVLVTAMDLRVSWTTNNSILDTLHPELRERFLSAIPDSMGEQGEMELAAEGLNFIRFKDLVYPLKWGREYEGWTLRVDYGLGDDGDMIVKLCKLHRFEITPLEGGSIELAWTISSSADIETEVVGYLGTQQQQNITISLLAPNKTAGDEAIDASNGSGAPGTNGAAGGTKAKKGEAADRNSDATQAFIAAHGTTH